MRSAAQPIMASVKSSTTSCVPLCYAKLRDRDNSAYQVSSLSLPPPILLFSLSSPFSLPLSNFTFIDVADIYDENASIVVCSTPLVSAHR